MEEHYLYCYVIIYADLMTLFVVRNLNAKLVLNYIPIILNQIKYLDMNSPLSLKHKLKAQKLSVSLILIVPTQTSLKNSSERNMPFLYSSLLMP